MADELSSTVSSDLTLGEILAACSEEETGVERNWSPTGQPYCSLNAPDWIPKAASESHAEKGIAMGGGYRTL